ncbi:MAG: hypothetical protein ACJ0BI_04455 [Paracoccaceae bacterium]
MANPESFLEEVAEEVRRDRLFKFFKKNGWIIVFVVLVTLCASIAYEWRKNSEISRAKSNGDLLALALEKSEKGNLEELIDLLSDNSPYLRPSSDLMAVTKLYYAELLYNIDNDSSESMSVLKEIFSNESISRTLRQLAKIKYLLLFSGDNKVKQDLIDELSSPDNHYRFLAQEHKVQTYLASGMSDEANRQIDILLNDLEVSEQQKRRLMDLKLAIR